jgi:3-hydroxyisobutyrate dehydrogenase-like beta-hydroxyacid dehydrogenase
MATSDFEPPRSRARQLNKDLHSVADFVAAYRLDLPVQAAVARQFQAYIDQGGSDADSASVSRLYVK